MKKIVWLIVFGISLGSIKCVSAKEAITLDDPKFFSNKVMAHALGGYDGNIYNNTEEALQNSIQNGFKFIEVDMTLTSDNKLVCTHGFDAASCVKTGVKQYNEVPTYKQFMTTKLHEKYKAIKVSTLIKYMKKYPDLLLEIDLKDQDAEHTKIMISELIKLCHNDAAILDRILLQFYNKDNYEVIDSVYHFKYYQYFTVKNDFSDVNGLIDFCVNNHITSVAVKYKYITEERVKLFKDNGIYILCFTVDDANSAKDFLNWGVDTICTNFLIPGDVK